MENFKFTQEMVLANRDLVTLRDFFRRYFKYTQWWENINESLVHLENMMDVLNTVDGDIEELEAVVNHK